MKGCYCLIIFLKEDKRIRINKNLISLRKGHYCYVGSALNNLEKRVERHLRKKKKKFWHIDYFLDHSKIVDVKLFKTNKKIECKIAQKVNKLSHLVIDGFGSSDCKCKGHLFYFKNKNIGKLIDGIRI